MDYEITEEGIRALTSGNIMFNNMANIYDNFMEYYLLINRLRRQLMETYRKDELSVMVGKIWIIDDNKDTVKIKESWKISSNAKESITTDKYKLKTFIIKAIKHFFANFAQKK